MTKISFKYQVKCFTYFFFKSRVQNWAKEISDTLHQNEKQFVRRDILLKSFSDIKIEVRNITAIVEKTTNALEELLERRGQAAEAIMRKAEELAANKIPPPSDYTFTKSHVSYRDIIKLLFRWSKEKVNTLLNRNLNVGNVDRSYPEVLMTLKPRCEYLKNQDILKKMLCSRT